MVADQIDIVGRRRGAHPTRVLGPRPPDSIETIGIGDRIDDFELLTELGTGAFARVFLARQRSMQRLVAVKISANHGAEPETLARLDHENVVRVFDQKFVRDRNLKLLYMQYVPGGTLLNVLKQVRTVPVAQRSGKSLLDAIDQALIDRGGIPPSGSATRAQIAKLSWPETVAWLGRRLADALDYASHRGVLHRDIKPANVLLTAEGTPKLADFNISYSSETDGTNPVSYFGGSLGYMSPEQLEAGHPGKARTAGELDTRSDIYALAVMLWELLAGRRPFDDDTIADQSEASLDRMLELRRRDPRELVGELPANCPATLRRILVKCLAPQRENRWQSGAEVAKQLDLVLDARARDLVDPPAKSWRRRLSPWPIPVGTVVTMLGYVFALTYNMAHDGKLVVALLSPTTRADLVTIANKIEIPSILFVTVVILYLSRYVYTIGRGQRRGKQYDTATLVRARTDSLLHGDRFVLVSFGAWLAGAMILTMTLITAGDVSAGLTIHIIASHLVSGAINVAYPFFVVTFYIVRCVYPTYLVHGETTAADVAALRSLRRRMTWYLAVAASVPLVGVLVGVTFLGPAEIELVIESIRWLCVLGVLAFFGAYWLYRKIDQDLQALERVVSAS